MSAKDYFSGHSKIYAAFRPVYPPALYQFIFRHLNGKSTAWDCATGNGQVAQYLAFHFKNVFATDISAQQLEVAVRADNIFYSVSPAEQTGFADEQFDLITVAQALHWFNVEEFYAEVRRTIKPGGLLAVWGYALLSVSPPIDTLFLEFYHNIVGPYWDSARKLVEQKYRDILFPFEEIESPGFSIQTEWTRDQFAGYLTSWSATQKFIQAKKFNPLDEFMPRIAPYWKEGETKVVSFPLFLRLGKVIR